MKMTEDNKKYSIEEIERAIDISIPVYRQVGFFRRVIDKCSLKSSVRRLLKKG